MRRDSSELSLRYSVLCREPHGNRNSLGKLYAERVSIRTVKLLVLQDGHGFPIPSPVPVSCSREIRAAPGGVCPALPNVKSGEFWRKNAEASNRTATALRGCFESWQLYCKINSLKPYPAVLQKLLHLRTSPGDGQPDGAATGRGAAAEPQRSFGRDRRIAPHPTFPFSLGEGLPGGRCPSCSSPGRSCPGKGQQRPAAALLRAEATSVGHFCCAPRSDAKNWEYSYPGENRWVGPGVLQCRCHQPSRGSAHPYVRARSRRRAQRELLPPAPAPPRGTQGAPLTAQPRLGPRSRGSVNCRRLIAAAPVRIPGAQRGESCGVPSLPRASVHPATKSRLRRGSPLRCAAGRGQGFRSAPREAPGCGKRARSCALGAAKSLVPNRTGASIFFNIRSPALRSKRFPFEKCAEQINSTARDLAPNRTRSAFPDGDAEGESALLESSTEFPNTELAARLPARLPRE